MILLTASELAEIVRLVNDHHAALAVSLFGPLAGIDPGEVARLEAAGLVQPGALDFVRTAYEFGQLVSLLGPKEARDLTPAEVRARAEDVGRRAPLSRLEQASLDAARAHAARHIAGLGNRVVADYTTAAVEADAKLRSKLRGEIREEVSEGLERRKTWREVSSAIGHRTEDWARDLDRIAHTEMTTSRGEGAADEMRRRGERYMARQPNPSACPECRRFYLDGRGVPRIYRLAELERNGLTNHGRKRADWKPVTGATHPWCVLPGQHVTTHRGDLPIESVRPGDLVLTHRGRWRRVTGTFRRFYAGTVVRLELLDGARLAVTANHELLEWRRGWQRADTFQDGAEVEQIALVDSEDRPAAGGEERRLARVLLSLSPALVPVAAVDLDGEFLPLVAEVDEEPADRLVQRELDSGCGEGVVEAGLKRGGWAPRHAPDAPHDLVFRLPPSAACGVRGGGDRLALLRGGSLVADLAGFARRALAEPGLLDAVDHGRPLEAGALGDFEYGEALLEVHSHDFGGGDPGAGEGLLRHPAGAESMALQHVGEDGDRDAEVRGDCARVPVLDEVHSDCGDLVEHAAAHVANVLCRGATVKLFRSEEWRGYVYNLAVEEDESYLVEGVATHNCSCSPVVVPEGWIFDDRGLLVPGSTEKSLSKAGTAEGARRGWEGRRRHRHGGKLKTTMLGLVQALLAKHPGETDEEIERRARRLLEHGLVQLTGSFRRDPSWGAAKSARASGLADRLEKAFRVGPPPARNRREHPFVGTAEWWGLRIDVENRRGSVRRGVDADGHRWSTKMHHDYGEIRRTEGADHDKVDVYLGLDPESEKVFVVHQLDPKTGKYDEDKVMLGWRTQAEAKRAYLRQYDRSGFWGGASALTAEQFVAFIRQKKNLGKKIRPKGARLVKAAAYDAPKPNEDGSGGATATNPGGKPGSDPGGGAGGERRRGGEGEGEGNPGVLHAPGVRGRPVGYPGVQERLAGGVRRNGGDVPRDARGSRAIPRQTRRSPDPAGHDRHPEGPGRLREIARPDDPSGRPGGGRERPTRGRSGRGGLTRILRPDLAALEDVQAAAGAALRKARGADRVNGVLRKTLVVGEPPHPMRLRTMAPPEPRMVGPAGAGATLGALAGPVNPAGRPTDGDIEQFRRRRKKAPDPNAEPWSRTGPAVRARQRKPAGQPSAIDARELQRDVARAAVARRLAPRRLLGNQDDLAATLGLDALPRAGTRASSFAATAVGTESRGALRPSAEDGRRRLNARLQDAPTTPYDHPGGVFKADPASATPSPTSDAPGRPRPNPAPARDHETRSLVQIVNANEDQRAAVDRAIAALRDVDPRASQPPFLRSITFQVSEIPHEIGRNSTSTGAEPTTAAAEPSIAAAAPIQHPNGRKARVDAKVRGDQIGDANQSSEGERGSGEGRSSGEAPDDRNQSSGGGPNGRGIAAPVPALAGALASTRGGRIVVAAGVDVDALPAVLRHEFGHVALQLAARRLERRTGAWLRGLFALADREGFVRGYAQRDAAENAACLAEAWLFDRGRLRTAFPRQFAAVDAALRVE